MHPFISHLSSNLEKMKKLALHRGAAVFSARDGFEKSKFWVLIFVILSSRTRDETTSKAVKRLIRKYVDERGLARADEKEVERLIYGVGFYRTKARRIISVARSVVNNGFPETFEELLSLDGVGRKTANVVLNIIYGKPVIGVDTHVHRISNRIGIVKTTQPEDTEKKLVELIPAKHRAEFNEIFVAYGQTVCFPKKPECESCVIKQYCNYYSSFSSKNSIKKH